MGERINRQTGKGNSGADRGAQQPYATVTSMVTGLPTPPKERAVSRALDGVSPARRLLNVKHAAEYLGGISLWTMRGLGWSGQVPEVRVGRRVLYDRQDLDRFIETSKQQR
ncbi:MAG: helix-turn-helix domain-containing protein [Candidatus Methylomirabilales bacterium]|nr:helix-turn-helix domain-containing protein [candidate division NC10 bacterium]